jgi:hypothetical protein
MSEEKTPTKTLQHLISTVVAYGGCVEYPIYLVLVLKMKFRELMIVYFLAQLIYYMLPYILQKTTEVNFVDLSVPPWTIQKPKQFIMLLHPHGMFTGTAGMYMTSRHFPPNTVALIDPLMYYLCPLSVHYIECVSGLGVSYLKHKNISRLLEAGNNVVVFAGGFNESVDFTDTSQSIHIDKYQYWMRMSRQFGTQIWSTLLYDSASRYFSQSSLLQDFRMELGRCKIPCILPTRVHFPEDRVPVYVRHIMWNQAHQSNGEIATKITNVVYTDRTHQKSTHHVECRR